MSTTAFKPQGVNNSVQAAYWHVAMGKEAAGEFNYLWHQYGRLENIWAALQDWQAADPSISSSEPEAFKLQRCDARCAVVDLARWSCGIR
ncbi:MAG: hypothetical protein IPJ85_00795 [Flavobacteriales bacterium]|nr:hypothetical protein [Flavobacteriales bacterium]